VREERENAAGRGRTYVAIDLKSFYASVECVDRGLDPLGVNLVVADASRTEKTICLAVSPSLKAYGVGGRPRLFEVVERVRTINAERAAAAPGRKLTGKSYVARQLKDNKSLAIDYIVAPPRMARYVEMSRKICGIYRRYISPDDIHVYSVDEIFADVTDYLKYYGLTARELAMKMIREVLSETGITATAGIGTNMFLCKIAMDIVAKHMEPDCDGVRLAQLDEMTFRKTLWKHRPITDFWMIGRGISKRLEKLGIYTMGDIARCSIGSPDDFYNEDLLYKTFGVNAELIIDHAWGYEPCTIADVKACKPRSHSISSGQVLSEPYPFEKAKLVAKEMTDKIVLELVGKDVVTDKIVLDIGYDTENAYNPLLAGSKMISTDHYGRPVPAPAHATAALGIYTSSTVIIREAVAGLFDKIADPNMTVRRITITACDVIGRCDVSKKCSDDGQMSFFDSSPDPMEEFLEKEHNLQKAVVDLQKRYGKNAVLKGMNLEEGATAIARNGQIGGHKA